MVPAFTPDPDAVERAMRDVEAVEYLVCDPCGVLRGKWAPASSLEKAYGEGIAMPFSLHCLDRWGREVPETGWHIETGDLDGHYRAVSPPRRATWRERPTAVVQLAAWHGDGAPFAGDPRHALVGVLDRLAKRDLRSIVAFELEFHLVADDGAVPPTVVGQSGLGDVAGQAMYDHEGLREHGALWDDVRRGAEALGVPIDTIVKEAGPGQFEVNLAHGPALAAADAALMLRHLVRECAARHCLRATFMAKPFADRPGNGCHLHASLVDGAGENAFGRDAAMLRAAIAGTLDHMPASLLGLIGGMNGFRRLAPGSYAPTRAVWGENNRSVAVRVPVSGRKDARLEHRIAGADACPYVVAALVLAAMLDGIERGAEPPPPASANAYEAEGAELSADPGAALAAHAASPFVRDALGAELAKNVHAILAAERRTLAGAIPPLEYATFL